jgi:hypothetical protein
MLPIETRGAAADPARSFNHLRAQVQQQILIILPREGAQIEAPDDGHRRETALEFEPDTHQPPQRRLAELSERRRTCEADIGHVSSPPK